MSWRSNGVGENEVKKLVASGEVGFLAIEKEFVSLTSESGKFAGRMDAQSKTTTGRFSTLKDTLNELVLTLGEPIHDAIRPLISVAIVLVSKFTPLAVEAGKRIKDAIQFVIAAFKSGQIFRVAKQWRPAARRPGRSIPIDCAVVPASRRREEPAIFSTDTRKNEALGILRLQGSVERREGEIQPSHSAKLSAIPEADGTLQFVGSKAIAKKKPGYEPPRWDLRVPGMRMRAKLSARISQSAAFSALATARVRRLNFRPAAAAGKPDFAVKAYELYSRVDPSLITEILDWFRANDRNVYKSALQSLATNRKLRLVYLQKKPLAEQYAWIHKMLGIKACESIGEQIMQVYLMSAQQSMLGMFCDGLGIPHDGKGSVVGELPKQLDQERLDLTVDRLVDLFDPTMFTFYLHAFNMQVPGGWPKLNEKLANDPRLTLGAAPAENPAELGEVPAPAASNNED